MQLELAFAVNVDVEAVKKILAPVEITKHEFDDICVDHWDLFNTLYKDAAREVSGFMDADLKELYNDAESGVYAYTRIWSPHRFNLPTLLELVDIKTGEMKFYRYL